MAEQAWQSSNDETGIAALVDRLQALAPHLMVLETTGGLEQLVVVTRSPVCAQG